MYLDYFRLQKHDRYIILFVFFFISLLPSSAQRRTRSLQFAMPLLILNSDARAGGVGDIGVATTSDVFSQYWNPSKYIFSLENSGIGLGYSSYLSKISNDIFFTKVVCFKKISPRSVFGSSLNYFNIGEVELTQEYNDSYVYQGVMTPNELSIDMSYSLLLSKSFSMGILVQWLHSSLQDVRSAKHIANSVAVGLSGFYQSEVRYFSKYKSLWRAGFNISNIGPKISYSEDGQEYFIPTNLKIGLGYELILQSSNSFLFSFELNKLLIPTPPVYGYIDKNGNGIKDADEIMQISKGKNSNVSYLEGILQSFYDAPDGLSEELHEITWALGVEYNYENILFFRGGYFYEHKDKGGRNYTTMGVGLKLKSIDFNLAYALSIANYATPWQNNIRLSLSYNL